MRPEKEVNSFYLPIWLPYPLPIWPKSRVRWLPNTWIRFQKNSWLPKRIGSWWKSMSVIRCQNLWKKSCRAGTNFMPWPVKRWSTISWITVLWEQPWGWRLGVRVWIRFLMKNGTKNWSVTCFLSIMPGLRLLWHSFIRLLISVKGISAVCWIKWRKCWVIICSGLEQTSIISRTISRPWHFATIRHW